MRWKLDHLYSYARTFALAVCLLNSTAILAEPNIERASNSDWIAAGKQVAFNSKKGNCLSCHAIKGGESAGTIGPSLTSMRARFSNRNKLKEQIWDARINNPHTIMPPFGKHRILNDQEIDQLVEYLYTL